MRPTPNVWNRLERWRANSGTRCGAVALVILTLGWVNLGVITRGQNPIALAAISVPDGGGACKPTASGVTREIRHQGSKILSATTRGTYCSGFTFQIAMAALAERGLIRHATVSQIRRFQRDWYGAAPDAAAEQSTLALERLGVGHRVALESTRAGDFLVLWRVNNSGHSAVVLRPIRDSDGRLIGIEYRGSQESTGGVGTRVEYFADVQGKNGKIIRERCSVARLSRSWSDFLKNPIDL